MNDEVVQISKAVHRLSAVMGRISDHCLQDAFGFGMTQFKIIWVLFSHREEGGVRQSDIAEWLSQTEAAISRQMKPMVTQGLIENRVDPKNRRSHIVRLTKEGESMATRGMRVLAAEHRPYIDKLTKRQQRDLVDMLESLFVGACACIGELPHKAPEKT